MRDEAVPEVCAELAALDSAAVRNRFALDILAAYTGIGSNAQNRKGKNRRTPCLCLAQVGADLTRGHANHAEALRLVKCPDLLLRLAERHAICKFTELGLRVRFFSLARTSMGGGGQLSRGAAEN